MQVTLNGETIQPLKMKSSLTEKIYNFFLLGNARALLKDDDLQALQRFNLFRTLSITTFVIGALLCAQIISFIGKVDLATVSITLLTIIIAVNYFMLNQHKNFRIAYVLIIASTILGLHLISYFSGGIRNSSIIYLGGIILTTFILLGNKEGRIVSIVIICNLIFFYVVTDFFGYYVRNIIDTDKEGHFLNLDYFISYTTGIFLLYSLSNNLEGNKNIVISGVTKSKNLLEEQNKELQKLSLVASKTDNAVIITDETGIVEWVNAGFTRLTGYEFDEIIGKRTNILHGNVTDVETIKQMKACVQEKRSFSGEVQKIRKDGQPFWMQVSITPIFDEQKMVSRFIQVESDITERKTAEIKMAEYYRYLEKANKELDKFAYVVSHDLKAPLRAIANLSTWIEEDIGEGFTPETSNNFKILKGRVERMESLINGILQYSRADRVKSPETMIHLEEMIDEIKGLYSMDKNISITIADRLPRLKGEKMKMEQVFSNLINNAIKHNDKSTIEIKISCKELEDEFLFSIEDNGPGIEPEYHEKVFVIFQTLKARDAFESTGVGLAIVKKIIDEAGGKIWIESDQGKFTRFLFNWPKENQQQLKPFQVLAETENSLEKNDGL